MTERTGQRLASIIIEHCPLGLVRILIDRLERSAPSDLAAFSAARELRAAMVAARHRRRPFAFAPHRRRETTP